jgi:hypothetical protein
MPRKPRVDPPPLESFEIEVNGVKIECEIRDETCVIKSPGYANRELSSDRLWNSIMPKVVADYLDVNGRKNVPPSRDYLASPTKFANQVAKWGAHFSGDLSSLRKEYYPKVLKQVQIFENAIKAKKQS